MTDGNHSIREVAANHGIKKSMLHKSLQKLQGCDEMNIMDNPPPVMGSNKYSSFQVFSNDEETFLENYLVQSCKMQYGLTYNQVGEFAYSYAVKLERKLGKCWEENKSAGVEWIKGFMRRNSLLILRKPEDNSLARNINFNEQNVNAYLLIMRK